MATSLSNTTSFVRRFSCFMVVFVILLFIVQATTGILIIPTVMPTRVPSTPLISDGCPPATNSYGKLSVIKIPSLTLVPGTKAIFSTDKSQTKFPQFPSSVYVYKLDKIYEKLDDVDRATNFASELGFQASQSLVTSTTIKWEKTNPKRILTFDKSNRKWDYTADIPLTNLKINATTFDNRLLLNKLKLSNSNYTNPLVQSSLILKRFDQTLESQTDLARSNIIQIDYYKNLTQSVCKTNSSDKIYTTETYAPEFLDQSYTARLTGNALNLASDLLSLSVREFELSKEAPAIYSTLTMDEAYLNLQNNKGILYWLLTENSNVYAQYKELKVKEFMIAVDATQLIYVEPQQFLDDDESTQFIQPYYKFSGKATLDNNQKADFIFLVPALKPEAYK